jgi:hypothetical protein
MNDPDGQNIKVEVNLLEGNIENLVALLTDYRKENELLRSELSTLQNILRTCKLPGSTGSSESGSSSGGEFAYSEKLQVKQKLLLILQKIEIELRNDQTL